ncbi:MAG: multi-sensor signal transduction histidine kinase [Chthonomonadales bacterium]|nr:multi-sensor signal transduction histidine kinase [Chthonomonadales bacterium]
METTRATRNVEINLESVLATSELAERTGRLPDYRAESEALVGFARELAASPHTILQKLCETTVTLCHAHSAGISILERVDGEEVFRWHAIAGEYAPHLWGMTPRDFGPCGITIDRDAPQLFADPGRYFTYFQQVEPPIVEGLLLPFHSEGRLIGTLWVLLHDKSRQFDQEDVRLLTDFSTFVASAYKELLTQEMTQQINAALVQEMVKRQEAEGQIEALNQRLQQAMRETDHRVKNNLQSIASLLDLHIMANSDTVSVEELTQLRMHIKTLASIHDMLTQDVKSTPMASLMSTREAFQRLLPMLQQVVGKERIQWSAADVYLPIKKGMSLAMLINELVCNAVKHGGHKVEVQLAASNTRVTLEVSDDGPGFPKGFNSRTARSFGLELVESVSRLDLGGTITYENRQEGGACVRITFPLPPS